MVSDVWTSRQRRVDQVKRRVSAPPPETEQVCARWTCNRPTQRSSGNGLSETYCKMHKEFLRRHGSVWRKSYSAGELRPYLEAARVWLSEHEDSLPIQTTLECLKILLAEQPEPLEARDVRWRKPEVKAMSMLARFGASAKTEHDLFAIALAVEAITYDIGPRDTEWTYVQIAKLIHRVNAGSHPVTSGGVRLPSKYPRSEGAKMRIAGKWVRNEARIFDLDGAVDEVIAAVPDTDINPNG